MISGNELYKYDVMDHYKNPRNFGLLPDADFSSQRLNPSCGDQILIGGFINSQGVITKLFFQGSGCMLSIAMASKLTDYAVGHTIQQVFELNEATVEKLLNIELGINRMQCGLLSIQALQQGLESFKKV